MKSLWDRSNRWLTWFHRWAGVVLCLLFAMWFASGAVLHFVGFPALSAHERHQGSVDLDFGQVAVSPAEALAKVPDAQDLRLVERAGQAAYLAQTRTGGWIAVSAQSGALLADVTVSEARTIAESFGSATAIAATGPISYDQWIVHQHFDPFRPFYRIRLNDTAQTDLYVRGRVKSCNVPGFGSAHGTGSGPWCIGFTSHRLDKAGPHGIKSCGGCHSWH